DGCVAGTLICTCPRKRRLSIGSAAPNDGDGAAPRGTGRSVPCLVRAGARGAGRGAERDGARLPGVRAHRDALRLSPVLGGLCAPRVPPHPALHGADRAVPPVPRLSGDLSSDPESLGGALHTLSRSTCLGYRLTNKDCGDPQWSLQSWVQGSPACQRGCLLGYGVKAGGVSYVSHHEEASPCGRHRGSAETL